MKACDSGVAVAATPVGHAQVGDAGAEAARCTGGAVSVPRVSRPDSIRGYDGPDDRLSLLAAAAEVEGEAPDLASAAVEIAFT
jgi:hypothetical protein